MPTDRAGNKITWKEFGVRWKQGIQNVTPLQHSKTTLFGYVIIVAGILWGLVLSFKLKQWWLFTILLGSFVITSTTVLGVLQKYFVLKKIDSMMKMEVTNNV